MKSIVKRTFEAARFPVGSGEREALNKSAVTSAYMPSMKFIIEADNFMSDGTINPVQPKISLGEYRTRREAEAAFNR